MIRRITSMSLVHASMVLGFLAGALLIWAEDARTEAVVLLAAMTFIALGFSTQYALRSPWRSTQGGKALMFTSLSLGVLGAYLSFSWLWGTFAYRNEVRSFLFLIVVLSLLYRWILLFMYQRADRIRAAQVPVLPGEAYMPTESKEDGDGVR